ncbi:MAG TPA: hypothetical protein VIV60_28830, partial [Polyangiaceae bacterium]
SITLVITGKRLVFMTAPTDLRRLMVHCRFALVVAASTAGCSPTNYSVAPASDATGGTSSAAGTAANAGNSGVGNRTAGSAGVGGTGAGATVTAPDASCHGNADCAKHTTTTLCDPATELCVECLPGKTDCGKGLYCGFDKKCHIGCDDATDCVTASCDIATHRCGGCTSNLQCQTGTRCDDKVGACVAGCETSSACPSGWACCSNTCVNLGLDDSNCGSCGTSCNRPNASVACLDSACVIQACKDGYANCNTKSLDGCETDVYTDASHCGACESTCTSPLVCKTGVCASNECSPGYIDCDGKPSNGCEANIERDTLNCGGCGIVCSTIYGMPTCTAGKCQITCNSGWGDCDGSTDNGCEANLSSSQSNCGRCSVACNNEHGSSLCISGKCEPTCAANYGDCDGIPANGCESNTLNDVNNCGGCGKACSLPHATSSCASGKCAILACDAGWADCNATAADGCESDLKSDLKHCGTCSTVCSAINGTPTCNLGQCAVACQTNYGNCDDIIANGCEADLTQTVAHCGVCKNKCPDTTLGTATCVKGECGSSGCTAPYGDCDRNAANGCESNSTSDVKNCGSCGTACSLDHATAGCSSGKCTIAGCADGWADCNLDPADGCEVNTTTDTLHCGGCKTVCNATNGNATCAGGVCGITCGAGFDNCNADVSDGCETNIKTNLSHCGACKTACTTSCVNGACATPCTGLCSNPTVITITEAHTYSNLGTADICIETASGINGGGSNNFAPDRTLYINSTSIPNNANWVLPLPARVNGGYCIHAGPGYQAFASITVW